MNQININYTDINDACLRIAQLSGARILPEDLSESIELRMVNPLDLLELNDDEFMEDIAVLVTHDLSQIFAPLHCKNEL